MITLVAKLPFSKLRFQKLLLAWYQQHGRKTLPWQQPSSPYRVWISEIMLQQTQVQTVIPYFKRFIKRFPTVKALSLGPEEEVLALWSGLGYYARARNLYKSAQLMARSSSKTLPDNFAELLKLPGIGRSTAGAILALAHEQPYAILDGNVKRVLSRVIAKANDSPAEILRQLWSLAERLTPHKNVRAYTQAIMDLGSLICTPSKPKCADCPLQSICQAYRLNITSDFPQKPKRLVKTYQAFQWLIIQHPSLGILLEKRPATGIWGGLWSLPECHASLPPAAWGKTHLGIVLKLIHRLPNFRHNLTHRTLDIEPIVCQLKILPKNILLHASYRWYQPRDTLKLGLAAPLRELLQTVFNFSLKDIA